MEAPSPDRRCQSGCRTDGQVSSRPLRSDHAQRARPRTVLKRRFEQHDLAIERHRQTPVPARDLYLFGYQDFEVALTADPDKERAKRQPHQAPSADSVLRNAQAEPPFGERIARSKIDSFHAI